MPVRRAVEPGLASCYGRPLVAPREPFHTLRWEFVPFENSGDRSIGWRWRAYTQSGSVALQSEQGFDTLTECMDHAKTYGYGQR